MMVMFGNASGGFGFFPCVVADFMSIANPTTFGLVLVKLGARHIFSVYGI